MTRKKLPEGERMVVLTVRVPQEVAELLGRAATGCNLTVSKVARHILNEWAKQRFYGVMNASPDNHPGA